MADRVVLEVRVNDRIHYATSSADMMMPYSVAESSVAALSGFP